MTKNKVNRLVVLSFLLALACSLYFILESASSTEPRYSGLVSHSIDRSVWLLNSTVDKTYQPVNVYFNDHQDYLDCEPLRQYAKQYFKDNVYGVNLGQSCEQLFSLVNLPNSVRNIPLIEDFIAAHEAFHISVQFQSVGILYEYSISESPDIGAFNEGISPLLNLPVNSAQCEAFEGILDGFDESHQKLLIWRATYEWVAEFYAKEKVFGNDTAAYISLRDNSIELHSTGVPVNIQDSNQFYKMSLDVIKVIESAIDRDTWQKRVHQGESIFDIFMEVNGCKTYTDDWPRYSLSEYNLIE
ncbi:hypothetical protein [Alteromonas gilva]|uniref:Uncharacterized protein n=1 Tax=Alteromonas gilva TaxID=2987522 RepID=A0ABT5KYI3_9ALTE|nr:hypothetical protein [Alteromonas gilva]MDC8829827.1 hypothetical protein [Alteromonas gilva]